MLFHEIYGSYYNAVAAILAEAIKGELTEKRMNEIVSEKAFAESFLTVIPSLKSGKWQLIDEDSTTPLEHKPSMPLTVLQKRWLKAISLDPRIKLFNVNFDFLGDVEPLFTPDDYVAFDKYNNGDPFEDDHYIRNFDIFLWAIKNKRRLKIHYHGSKGHFIVMEGDPYKLEYSEKDDKFRVITVGRRSLSTVNLAKIRFCAHDTSGKQVVGEERAVIYDTITVKILDERNAMERFMLHFAHFEKQAEKLDEKHYLVKIKYARDDASEMVIRILSFGPRAEVLEPQSFRNLIVEKLKKQASCGLK